MCCPIRRKLIRIPSSQTSTGVSPSVRDIDMALDPNGIVAIGWPKTIRMCLNGPVEKRELLVKLSDAALATESRLFLESLLDLSRSQRADVDDKVTEMRRMYFGENAPLQINVDYDIEHALLVELDAQIPGSSADIVWAFAPVGDAIAHLLFAAVGHDLNPLTF